MSDAFFILLCKRYLSKAILIHSPFLSSYGIKMIFVLYENFSLVHSSFFFETPGFTISFKDCSVLLK